VAKVASECADGNSRPDSRYAEFDCTVKNSFNTQSNKNMNAKQTIPIIAKIAPPLLFGVAIYYGLKWLFSADDTEKKPEIKPTDIETERLRLPRKDGHGMYHLRQLL
jgi:hypothetical protein